MKKEDVKLTKDPVKNIQAMAPQLTEKQQYIVLGMALAAQTQKDKEHEGESKQTG